MGKNARETRKEGKNPLSILAGNDPKAGKTREKTVYTNPEGRVTFVPGGSPGLGKGS